MISSVPDKAVVYKPRPVPVVITSQKNIETLKAIRDSQMLKPDTNIELAGAIGGLEALVEIYETLYHEYWRMQYERDC